jgi:hypothetical protein
MFIYYHGIKETDNEDCGDKTKKKKMKTKLCVLVVYKTKWLSPYIMFSYGRQDTIKYEKKYILPLICVNVKLTYLKNN